MAQDFERRLSSVPSHGLGLSVDVYSPNLFDLLDALASHGVAYDYLEIFKASPSALAEVRRRLPEKRLEYHAEGLWMTQPEWGRTEIDRREISSLATHLATLGCSWVNHECATKQMAGLLFGTYLPPLFTRASADVTAAHASHLQQTLDGCEQFRAGRAPLVLLEIPPLTYFGFGDVPVTEFFQRIADQASCGFVLDLGHVWTYYRYSDACRRRSISSFLCEFLESFPLDRVVQIHLAGLAVHESVKNLPPESSIGADPPAWLDAHHAPIPGVLYDMLDQVLAHPKLCALKGMALEVDTKSIPLIAQEFDQARQQFGDRVSRACQWPSLRNPSRTGIGPSFRNPSPTGRGKGEGGQLQHQPREPRDNHVAEAFDHDALRHQYDRYARIVSGQLPASQAGLPSYYSDGAGLDLYRQTYLSYEILHWGGDVQDMFPETCRQLASNGIASSAFVDFWFREPQSAEQPYDFFLMKVTRFIDHVRHVWPAAGSVAEQEADVLRDAYHAACETAPSPSPSPLLRRGEDRR